MRSREVFLGIAPGIRGRLIRMSMGDPERADELAQRLRVRVWETTRNRTDEIRSPAAYSQGVLMRIHQEFLREEKRHRHLDVDMMPVPCQKHVDPSTIAEKRELFRLVRRAVNRLTSTSQMVIRMRYFEELQQRQIAQHMGTNEVRVCRLLKRARARLAHLLEF